MNSTRWKKKKEKKKDRLRKILDTKDGAEKTISVLSLTFSSPDRKQQEEVVDESLKKRKKTKEKTWQKQLKKERKKDRKKDWKQKAKEREPFHELLQ